MHCFIILNFEFPVLGISDPPDSCEEPSPTIGPPTRLALEDPICFGPLVAVAFLFIVASIVIVILSIIIKRLSTITDDKNTSS